MHPLKTPPYPTHTLFTYRAPRPFYTLRIDPSLQSYPFILLYAPYDSHDRSHNFSPTPIVLISFHIQFLPPSHFIQSALLTEVENWSQPGVVGGLPDGLNGPEEVLGLVSVRVLLVDLKRVEVAILLGERILAGTCCHLVVEVVACITVAGLWPDHHHSLALKDQGNNTQYFRINNENNKNAGKKDSGTEGSRKRHSVLQN